MDHTEQLHVQLFTDSFHHISLIWYQESHCISLSVSYENIHNRLLKAHLSRYNIRCLCGFWRLLQFSISLRNFPETQNMFAYYLFLLCPIVLKCCRRDNSDIGVTRAKFNNDFLTELDIMDKMSFYKILISDKSWRGGRSYIATAPESNYADPVYGVATICHQVRWLRWDKMDDIFQTTFSNGYSWMKMYEFRLRFHWIFS